MPSGCPVDFPRADDKQGRHHERPGLKGVPSLKAFAVMETFWNEKARMSIWPAGGSKPFLSRPRAIRPLDAVWWAIAGAKRLGPERWLSVVIGNSK